ncbi:MAG: pyridoxal phosphate-dependent aminotransferase, partial [Armatimonadota bacterium]
VDVVGFAAGEPDFDTPEHIKKAAADALASGFTKYTPSTGTPDLKKAIVDKLERDNGLHYDVKQIAVSVGAKHSIYNTFQALLNPGDEVIIPAPYWVSYPEQVLLAEGKPVVVKTDESTGFRMSAQQFEAAVTPKTKLVVINSPSNPTGGVYDRSDLEAIAEVAVRKNILVLSDEIYEKIVYGVSHVSIASLGEEIKKLTIVINGMSKAYSMTGWRLGYLAAEAEIVAAVAKIQDQSTSNPTSFAQVGGVAALNGPQEPVEMMRLEFEKRRNRIVEMLNAIPGVTCLTPGGAFYVFPNVAGVLANSNGKFSDADSFAEYFLETAKVSVVPGTGFGAPQNVRLSYATSMANIEKGVERLHTAIEAL